ncbi:MAG TPA: M1 family aminopeptidase, partial [Thermodesulfobacteriota bacterium]|nr:M1 family aminopeptidase [Thermodesulfobacteriota bacterium]
MPNFQYDIRSHSLSIEIQPAGHFIRAEDRIEVHLKAKKQTSLSFLLHPNLKIKKIINLDNGKPVPWKETSFSRDAKRFDLLLKEAHESLHFSVSYEGRIYDPVVKEKALQFVRGDQTSGLIDEEGVYLSSSSHWYPDRPDSMATFKVNAKIPDPFRIVTQGEILAEELKNGSRESRWSYDLPAESLTLVAGKYSVKTRNVNGIRVSTYFFPQEDHFSDAFLNAADEYLRMYSDLLGPYPFKKFDIVQNFFSSGYGIPTFTLLSPDAIRQGKEFLRPGALDHEIVHSWWGHAVSSKPGTGNWVEALTSYCTNYYYKELKMGEEGGRKHRQEILQKYAIQVPESKDYPLRQFEGKEDEVGGQIGYGKGSMVFHMLRMIVGKNLFFETLRKFAMQYKGKQANWEDLQEIFKKNSGRNLDGFFSQWLNWPGGPRLKLENVNSQAIPSGYRISGEVVQEGEAYELSLPIEVDDGAEKRNIL